MNLETVIQSDVSQKVKSKYHILMHVNGTAEPICRAKIERQDIENGLVETMGEK